MVQLFNSRYDQIKKQEQKREQVTLYQGKIVNPIFHSVEVKNGVKRSVSARFLDDLDDFLVKQQMLDIEDKSAPQKRLLISRDKYKTGTSLDEQIEQMRQSHVVEFVRKGDGFNHNTEQIKQMQLSKKKRQLQVKYLDLSITGNQKQTISSTNYLETSQKWSKSSSLNIRSSMTNLHPTPKPTGQSSSDFRL
ncbi:hypothetical protein SS50377_24357 [Spironucleus salmonicida]|uniref:Uncharacterized protein n=1 Tax=Spironucleus salmonicida TaxID=348837 RepID=V6LN21_9EUKA|nr:hypothetical protein SS50377_24357 [Spironucleus salmonicida]|eukprot:EST46092.1 Hypothetical protein SS50377_14083 [Spironucleus salmonicida]